MEKVLALLIFCVVLTLYTKEISAKPNEYRIRTIVIDAGHGGRDPGAVGKSSYEKDIALNISLKLGKYIEKYFPEIKVVYTRKNDIFLSLNKRSEIANKNNAELFLSIHINANKDTKIYGTETYTLGLHKTKENLEVAMKENSVMLYEEDYSTKYEGFDPKNPASYIIFNLLQGINREQSIKLAELTEHQFKNRAGRHSRGVREAGFWVLNQVSMPSILIEAGFISNLREEKFLNTKKGQEYIASAIYRAFKDYKKNVEGNSVFLEQKPIAINTATDTSKVEYCVQVRSSSEKIPLNSSIFKGLGKVSERKVDEDYKYIVGVTNSYEQVLTIQKDVRKKITDCFVVAFFKGERIPISEAKKIAKK